MNKIVIGGVVLDEKNVVKRYASMRPTAHITERQAAIFENKFGINDGLPKTYAEVGLKFGISRERVRQLCAKVLYEIGLL